MKNNIQQSLFKNIHCVIPQTEKHTLRNCSENQELLNTPYLKGLYGFSPLRVVQQPISYSMSI